MIIDKILAHGVYEQHSGFFKYTFKYDDTTGSIIIHIQTASVDKFAGSSEQERMALQQRFYMAWYNELMGELATFFPNSAINDNFVTQATDYKTLTITAAGFKYIEKFANDNSPARLVDLGCGKLPEAIRVVNALNIKHPFATLDSSLVTYHDALLHYNAQNAARDTSAPTFVSLSTLTAATSLKDSAQQNANFDSLEQVESEMAGNKLKAPQTELNTSSRDLGKNLDASKKLPESNSSIETEVFGEDYHDNKVFKAAAKSLASRESTNPVMPSASESVSELILNNDNVIAAAQNKESSRTYKDKSINTLNLVQDRVYDRIKMNCAGGLLPHGQKEFHINEIKNIVRPIKDIEILSDIYHLINHEPNKKALNVYKNSISDMVFFKNNTNSWQDFIEVIRKQAFKVLLNNLGIGDIIIDNIIKHENTAIDGKNPVTIPEPQKVIDTLKHYMEDKLFCEHRSNNFFRNNLHATTAVKNLRTVIEVCKNQIERNKQPIFEH